MSPKPLWILLAFLGSFCPSGDGAVSQSCVETFAIRRPTANLTSICPTVTVSVPDDLLILLQCRYVQRSRDLQPNCDRLMLTGKRTYCLLPPNLVNKESSELAERTFSFNETLVVIELQSYQPQQILSLSQFCRIQVVGANGAPYSILRSAVYSSSDAGSDKSKCDNGSRQVKPFLGAGRQADPNSYPWMVFLTSNGVSLCGGTLLTAKFVLTAAHCVRGSGEFLVFYGLNRLDLTSERFVTSEAIIVHPKYLFPNNDIALVRLATPIHFSDTVWPVCLPTRTAESGERLLGLSWGYEGEVLKQNYFYVIADSECQNVYTNITLDTAVMCTKDDPSQLNCEEDNVSSVGVPFTDGTFTLYGIVSFTPNPCTVGRPTGHTEIYPYLPWINSIIKA